jgi:hypothetical protein
MDFPRFCGVEEAKCDILDLLHSNTLNKKSLLEKGVMCPSHVE